MRITSFAGVLFLIHWLLVPGAIASEQSVALQAEIDAAGARWQAGDNWLTALPEEDRDALLGGILPGSFTPEAVEVNPRRRSFDTTAHDWRDMNGINWMTPVKNQGNCGACSAFASLGCLEAVIRIAGNTPALEIDLSEQHVFSCANGDCPTGLYMGDAFDFIVANGVCDEACLPYEAVDDNCADLCADWQSRVEFIDSWELLWQYTVDTDELKERVLNYPVACYLEVYGDFMSYQSGIYEHVSGNLRGGHFVVIVGWNDTEDYWICKNSWGANWGEDGYFRIKRGETLIGTWAMVPHYTAPVQPTPTPTATAIPELGVTLEMPRTEYSAGDTFYLNAQVSNPGTPLVNIPLIIFLDVAGQYWFWPAWTQYPNVDFDIVDVTTGVVDIAILDPFIWPIAGSGDTPASFWAAMLKQDSSEILGAFDRAEWSF